MWRTRNVISLDTGHPAIDALVGRESLAVREITTPLKNRGLDPITYATVLAATRGCSRYHINGHSLLVQAPAILIHPSGVSLHHQGCEEVDYHSSYLCFKGPVERLWEGLRSRKLPYVYLHQPDPSLLDAATTCVDQAFDLSWKDAWGFVESISQLFQQLAPYSSDCTEPVPKIVQALQNAMLGNWNHPCSAGDAARKLGMSRSDFYRRFQAEVGCPPAEWIRKKRIILAQNYLEHGFTVSEVSDKLNFSSPFAFSKSFKSVTGFSPRNWRSIRKS